MSDTGSVATGCFRRAIPWHFRPGQHRVAIRFQKPGETSGKDTQELAEAKARHRQDIGCCRDGLLLEDKAVQALLADGGLESWVWGPGVAGAQGEVTEGEYEAER